MSESKEKAGGGHLIVIRLDEILAQRDMTLSELSRRTGVSRTNLDKLKNGRATGIIWETLLAICDVLQCPPGALLDWRPKTGREQREDPHRTHSVPSLTPSEQTEPVS